LLESIQTNPTTPLLPDDMSVVHQPWGKGQFHARLSHLTDTVKAWAKTPRPARGITQVIATE
jgi:hypothetical protein